MTRNQIKTTPLSVAGGGLLSRDFRSESKGTVHEDDDEKEMADYFGEDGEATISRQAKFGGDNRTGEARGSVGGEEKDAESGAKATSSSSSSSSCLRFFFLPEYHLVGFQFQFGGPPLPPLPPQPPPPKPPPPKPFPPKPPKPPPPKEAAAWFSGVCLIGVSFNSNS
jgi:hypothetical protein